MDFRLTTDEDIESELLHWDDDDDEEASDQHDNNAKSAAVSSTDCIKQAENMLRQAATSARETPPASSLNYFNVTAFNDRSNANNPLTSTSRGSASTETAEPHPHRGPQHQHLSDQNNFLEPIFPPNYFLSGLPWDPSQAVTNPHVPKAASSSHQAQAHAQAQAQAHVKQAQQNGWGAAQISQQIAMHNANNQHQHAQALAAAAAAAASVMIPQHNSPEASPTRTITDASTTTVSSSSSSNPPPSKGRKKKKAGKAGSNHNAKGSSNNQDETPPFYLFDAPCELRANFLQAQRRNDVTSFQDSNSFHYGMAVNGFHPQVNAQVNPIMPASLGAAVLPNGKLVEFIDGRHKHKRKISERNEREQQRAQKITELIDKLRNTMEKGGWKVEMKSKYQILSTSADYLRNLIDTTKEKEDNLEKAKAELAIRNQQIEEDRALNDGRSDPASVTSSLTACSSSGKEGLKRKGSEEPQEPPKKYQKTARKIDDDSHHTSNHSIENMDSNDSGKMTSSFSDTTDSQGSSGGVGSNDHEHRHTNTIFTRDRKRKHRVEKTSLDEDFQLSYQEVFLASNVPQLIATPAGRIVACNDFFFRVTGLTQKDVKRITIFSMVQVDKLSTLFDLVADSLRKSNGSSSKNDSSNSSSKYDSSSSLNNVSISDDKEFGFEAEFETATLPCVPFPQELLDNENGQEKKKLFMNVTFMYDENPSKRCIHCALTDKPGSGGNIGIITPELLSMLFPHRGTMKPPPEKTRCNDK